MTDAYNASDTRAIRRLAKLAKQAQAERQAVILNFMSGPAGRSYMHERLVRCHVFSSSYNASALAMAFAEGERNVGLQDLNDIMRFAPDQYIAMMREANDREIADGRRTDTSEPRGNSTNDGRSDTGSESFGNGAISEYEPGDSAGGDEA